MCLQIWAIGRFGTPRQQIPRAVGLLIGTTGGNDGDTGQPPEGDTPRNRRVIAQFAFTSIASI
jgi:hypothetical protein